MDSLQNLENAETVGDLFDRLRDVPLDEIGSQVDTGAALYSSGFTAGMNTWWSWAFMIISIVSMWLIFNKAKQPGWAAIIPFYNIWVALEVIGKPWWWLLLLFVPIVNIVFGILMCRELARVFKQGVAFTVGLVFLPFIFLPLLAFGPYTYTKPKNS
jgi:hypothetical protein